MKNVCKMISLDTASTKSGWAYWENAILTKSGVLYAEEKDSFDRIENMGRQMMNLLKEHDPIIVVIEQSTSVKDPKTFRMLSEIVGMARGWAILRGADYVEYGPNTWRRFVADKNEKVPTNRDICKPWDIKKVKDIFGIDTIDDNEADAILVGLARIKEMCG